VRLKIQTKKGQAGAVAVDVKRSDLAFVGMALFDVVKANVAVTVALEFKLVIQ
jgi:hypothetical protein